MNEDSNINSTSQELYESLRLLMGFGNDRIREAQGFTEDNLKECAKKAAEISHWLAELQTHPEELQSFPDLLIAGFMESMNSLKESIFIEKELFLLWKGLGESINKAFESFWTPPARLDRSES